MSVSIRIPAQLRTLTGGAGEVSVEATTVEEASRPSTPPTPASPTGSSTTPVRSGASSTFPGRRGRPVPRGPRHPGGRRPDDLD